MKAEVQTSVKASEVQDSSNAPAIQMTEIQQPGLNAFQTSPKVARSTVVQQLLRKVPVTGAPTLQVSASPLAGQLGETTNFSNYF